MKKIAFILALAFLGQICVHAQPFKKGDKVLNLGIGIGTGIYSGGAYSMRIPPVAASFEVGVSDKLGIGYIGAGGVLGIAGSKYEVTILDTYGWKYTYIIVGGRAAYHFDLVDDLDIYAGLMAGVSITTSKEIGDPPIGENPESTGYAHYEFAGIRYYVSSGFALMAELGYGVSYLRLGVAFKF